MDMLGHVAAELALGDRLDQVEREMSAQLILKRNLQGNQPALTGSSGPLCAADW